MYDPNFAARQVLDGGTVSHNGLRSLIPSDVKNTFTSSDTIATGYKYDFSINGTKIQVKWHSADANVALKYPGSNSGDGWTEQTKIKRKLLGADGNFYKNRVILPIFLFQELLNNDKIIRPITRLYEL